VQASQWYNRVMQRVGLKERLRITWGAHPKIAVVSVAASAGGGQGSPCEGLEAVCGKQGSQRAQQHSEGASEEETAGNGVGRAASEPMCCARKRGGGGVRVVVICIANMDSR
jgi:hypothetical protein